MHLIIYVQHLFKKLQKTSIEQASSLSVLKSKVKTTSNINSQLSNPSSSKMSTGPKVKPSVLRIKKLAQCTYQKIVVKYQKIPMTLMSIILHQFQMKMMNTVLNST